MMSVACGGKVPMPRAKLPTRVLIVDNELLVRWSLSAGLSLAGFETLTATGADEALELARQRPPPDVVLLDAGLYDGDAAALLEDLRLAAPGCRVVALTTAGHETPAWKDITVITKPFDLADVVRRVEAAQPPLSPIATAASVTTPSRPA